MKKESGIFILKCLINDKAFISHSHHIHTVYESLKSKLNLNTCQARRLQMDWDKFGSNAFEFQILEIVRTDLTSNVLLELTQKHIEEHQATDPKYGYNPMQSISTRNKKENWEASAEDIHTLMNKFIAKCDKNITATAERLNIIQTMDLDNNETIINYHTSKGFVNKQVKLKTSHLAENDQILNKYQRMAYYLIYLPQKEKNKLSHPYLSLNALKNKNAVKSKKSTEQYQRVFYVADFIKKWRNQDSVRSVHLDYMDLPDFDPHEKVVSIDLANYKHVREILMDYANLKNESKTIGVIWKIVCEFEALVASIQWSFTERLLLHLVIYSNEAMENMAKIMEQKYKQNISYDKIRRAIRETIPKKIADRCSEKEEENNPQTVYKKCANCQANKPATKKYYTIDQRKKDGLDGRCKICEKERMNNAK